MTVDQLIRELQRWPGHTVVRAHNGLIEGDDERVVRVTITVEDE